MRRFALRSLPVLLAFAGACASSGAVGQTDPADRVLMDDGRSGTIRQSTLGERVVTSFAAPLPRVYAAITASYAELGIEANYADQPNGRYGARNYVFPRSLSGERIGTFFGCGSTMTGALVDIGRVTSDVMTTLVTTSDGATQATFYVTGTLRRNDGNSGDPVNCASTGKLEETLRASVERKLAGR